jgi:predicted nucleic acid-binding protein
MKGVDTPVLLGFLHGQSRAKALLAEWAGEELATTELNFFELESIAARSSGAGGERRHRILENLRRRLTVLPIDTAAARQALALRQAGRSPRPLAEWLMLGAISAAGCSEWATTTEVDLPKRVWRVRSRRLDGSGPKGRPARSRPRTAP